MALVIEQMGGRVEGRAKINQPTQSNWSGPQHIYYAPSGMPVWGFMENVRKVREAICAIDFASL